MRMRMLSTFLGLVVALSVVLTSGAASARQESGTPVASICGVLAGAATPASEAHAHDDGMDMTAAATPDAAESEEHSHDDEAVELGVIPDFDLVFIDLMIPHHESAVVMAQIALERAEHPEIIELANNIISSQTAEIAQMESWRAAWYPDAPELSMDELNAMMDGAIAGLQDPDLQGSMGEMDMSAEALALCTVAEPFDLAFINAMIPHHQGAVAMANAGLENSTHPELLALHQVIIDAQQAEIDQMEAWRAAWYGQDAPATPVG